MEANQQGTFYKSISIERNGESHSNTILKTEFLKKTENYSCLVQDFVTNITPRLNTSKEDAFQVFVRGAGALVLLMQRFQHFGGSQIPNLRQHRITLRLSS